MVAAIVPTVGGPKVAVGNNRNRELTGSLSQNHFFFFR